MNGGAAKKLGGVLTPQKICPCNNTCDTVNLYRIKSCTGYYHQVNSFGSHNIAVAILFSRLDKLEKYNDTGCGNSSYVPLSQLDVDWKYPGYGRMTMGNAHLETAR
jgi:hypothetical protein